MEATPRKEPAAMREPEDIRKSILSRIGVEVNHIEGEPDNVTHLLRRPVTPPGEHGQVGTKIDPDDMRVLLIVGGVVVAVVAAAVIADMLRHYATMAGGARLALQRQQEVYYYQQMDTNTVDGAIRAYQIDVENYERHQQNEATLNGWYSNDWSQ